jgi:hypothetical protein
MKLSKVSACLCVALLLVVLLPAFANNTNLLGSFNSVALAGHVQAGGEYCTCGCAGCICDPGETANCLHTGSADRADQGEPSGDKSPVSPASGDGGMLLFSSLVLMALFRFLWR